MYEVLLFLGAKVVSGRGPFKNGWVYPPDQQGQSSNETSANTQSPVSTDRGDVVDSRDLFLDSGAAGPNASANPQLSPQPRKITNRKHYPNIQITKP
jgi:hypothetical protein